MFLLPLMLIPLRSALRLLVRLFGFALLLRIIRP